jgi:phosphoenolpyruvate---glycerone phosphotransferase subunit DhaM
VTVGLVLVSHSRRLVEGLGEMLAQLGDAPVAVAGGVEDGGLGTDAIAIQRAVESLARAPGVAVLVDLGSAVLAAEAALELLDAGLRGRTRLVDAPLVEGAVAAAVEAGLGADLDAVVGAAEAARLISKLGEG